MAQAQSGRGKRIAGSAFVRTRQTSHENQGDFMKTWAATLLVGVFLMAGLVPESGFAETVPACAKKKTGALRVSQKCKKKRERPINLSTGSQGVTNLQGLQGPVGPTGPMGPAGPPGKSGDPDVRVYDANGQFLGFLADPTVLTVYVPELKATAPLINKPENPDYGNVVGLFETQYFSAAGCNGASYYPARYTHPEIVRKDGKFYIATAPGASRIPVASWRGTAGAACVTPNPAPEYWAVSEYQLIEVTLPFTTPVAFPLRFE
jgi:hypothetical protein